MSTLATSISPRNSARPSAASMPSVVPVVTRTTGWSRAARATVASLRLVGHLDQEGEHGRRDEQAEAIRPRALVKGVGLDRPESAGLVRLAAGEVGDRPRGRCVDRPSAATMRRELLPWRARTPPTELRVGQARAARGRRWTERSSCCRFGDADPPGAFDSWLLGPSASMHQERQVHEAKVMRMRRRSASASSSDLRPGAGGARSSWPGEGRPGRPGARPWTRPRPGLGGATWPPR